MVITEKTLTHPPPSHHPPSHHPTHHKLKLQERARIVGYLENRPYINPKISKLGPTLAPKITCQGQNTFKMTSKSKKSKYQKKILQMKSYLSITVKPQKLFRPHLNSKHRPIEPKKAQNDPPKNKNNQKVRKLKIFKLKVISLMSKH